MQNMTGITTMFSCVFGIVLVICTVRGATSVNTTLLMEQLFTNYHSTLRPECEEGAAVQSRIGMALRQIIDMNERQQILEINAWIRLAWDDCHLVWDANETGIDLLVLPYNKVWVPDITLYDNAETELGGLKDFRASVYSDGTVTYNFPTIIQSLCKVDVTFFPFDTQICKLTFGSWAYNGFELNVTKRSDTGDISSYIDNGEWHIVGVPAIRHELYYGCCPEPYPDVTFYVIMQRKPLFYLLNLLFPCTLISTVAILGFLLPPDSGEKVSLEITVLLSLAVFLLVVSETMPPTSETFPFIGVYFACAMLLVSLSCLMTVTVLNLHFRGSHGKEVPLCVRNIFLHGLAKLLCVKVVSRRNHLVHPMAPQVSHENNLLENCGSIRSHKLPNGSAVDHGENNLNNSLFDMKELNANRLQLTELEGSQGGVPEILNKQLEILKRIESSMDVKKSLEESESEWQKLAQVVDRLFLIIFSLIQVITTLAILLRISTADSNINVT